MLPLNLNGDVETIDRNDLPMLFIRLYFDLIGGKGGFFSANVDLKTRDENRDFNSVVVDFDTANRNVIVWDRHAGDYRAINIDGVNAIRANKKTYVVK